MAEPWIIGTRSKHCIIDIFYNDYPDNKTKIFLGINLFVIDDETRRRLLWNLPLMQYRVFGLVMS